MAIQKVAVFGASGNFGTSITAALVSAGFDVTAISRADSTATFPPGLRVAKVPYTAPDLLAGALEGHDAAVCAVGPGGIALQSAMVDAAEAAGVRRFVVDDFGWGPTSRSFPEFAEIQKGRVKGWDHARRRAEENDAFSWTGISTGNPIDWALRRFPLMGFDIGKREAVIYDAGTEQFSGTTLEGIGQAVVGVLTHPEETKNRFVRVMSIKTCQNELLEAFEGLTGSKWEVRRDTTRRLLESGQEKNREGRSGWVLELAVTQLFHEGEGRGLVARTREESDSGLLGVREESARDVAAKVLGL